MTNDTDELRLKIAKAKFSFWQIQPPFNMPWVYPVAKGENPNHPKGQYTFVEVDTFDFKLVVWQDYVPDWPRDIAAAWELVEEMKQAGLYFKISTLSDTPGNYHVIFRRTYDSEVEMFDAPTAPEAICRAWLAWKEAQCDK